MLAPRLPPALCLAALCLAAAGCEEERARGGRDTAAEDAAVDQDGAVVDGGLADAARIDAGRAEDAGLADSGAPDTGARPDAGPPDVGLADSGAPDVGFPDAGAPDTGPADVGLPDTGVPDVGFADVGFPDSGAPDAGFPDAGPPDAGTVACTHGGGRLIWRLTFPSNHGGYARVEAWEAACAYSLADQACSVSGDPLTYANWGPGVVFDSSRDFFRVRFSVAGMQFSSATLYVAAHADGSGLPNGVLESPIYGALSFAPSVPSSTHRVYAIDWSSFLSPNDPPSLTAVTVRSMPTGLAVSAIELCVQ